MNPGRSLVLIASLAAAVSVDCGSSTEPAGRPNIVVVPDTFRLGRGDSLRLTAVGVDGGGRTVPGVVLTFASSDTTIVRVRSTGWVRSVGPVGSALVSVSGQIGAELVSRPIPAFVTAIPRTLVVAPGDTTIPQLGQAQLRITVRDGLNDPVPNPSLTYQSLAPTVLTVSTTGRVTTTGPAGTGLVVVRAGNLADSTRITVAAVAESIAITPRQASAYLGDSVQFTGTVYDRHGDVMTGAGALISWTPTNPPVATVSATGLARAQALGTTGIRAAVSPAASIATLSVLDSGIVARLPLPDRPLGVAVSGNIAYVSRLDAARLQRLNLATLAFTDSVTVGNVPCLIVFNAAGTRAYVANQFSQSVSIINVSTNALIGTIPVTGDPYSVALSANGNTLFVTSNVNRLYKINLTTNTVVDSLNFPATSHHFVAHPNDTLLYVSTRDAGSVLEINWRTMTVVRTFTVGGRTQAMAIAPDVSELYVTNEISSVLHVITLSNGAATNIPLAAGAHSISLNATGTQLYVGLLFAGEVQVINRVARTTAKTIITGGVVREMALDAARQRIVVANEAGWVDILR